MSRLPLIEFICLSLILTACATAPPVKSQVERYWPLPPDPPVISYVSSFSEPKDMGEDTGWFRRIFRFFVGEDEMTPHMIRPYAVATDGKGRVVITDTGLQVVHIYDFPSRRYRQLFWIERGLARLRAPVGLALDENGMIYVSDSEWNRIFVYESKNRVPVRVIGEPGQFQRVTGLAYDSQSRRLYAVDTLGNQILVFNPNGEKLMSFGQRGKGEGELNFPTHIAVDSRGLVYVTDSMNFRVQIFDPDGKFRGQVGRIGTSIGNFSKPKGVAIDSEGHIYVVDGIFDTVQIFNQKGEILMNFGQTGENEGDFWLPSGIAVDPNNRIYVADTYNQRVAIYRFLGEPKFQ